MIHRPAVEPPHQILNSNPFSESKAIACPLRTGQTLERTRWESGDKVQLLKRRDVGEHERANDKMKNGG
jgi:hypothetical protein